mgnify:CR=1 FL=1|jgi:hypothetical protein
MNIIKPLGNSVDIRALASNVGEATVVSVLNTDSSAVIIVNTTTGFDVYIGAGERVLIEKFPSHVLDGTAGLAPIYAAPVAYRG